jgi:hypothetical protein
LIPSTADFRAGSSRVNSRSRLENAFSDVDRDCG